MHVAANEAKLEQLLDAVEREPVTIERAGRRHSVLVSAVQYDALLATSSMGVLEPLPAPRTADEFYLRYKDWVDEQNARFERIGIWNEEFRTW